MRQARLRFHRRYISRCDQLIENVLLPVLLIMVLVCSVYNIGSVT